MEREGKPSSSNPKQELAVTWAETDHTSSSTVLARRQRWAVIRFWLLDTLGTVCNASQSRRCSEEGSWDLLSRHWQIAARSSILDLAAIALRRGESFLLCRDFAGGSVSGMKAGSNLTNLLLLHKKWYNPAMFVKTYSCHLLLLQSDGRLRFLLCLVIYSHLPGYTSKD